MSFYVKKLVKMIANSRWWTNPSVEGARDGCYGGPQAVSNAWLIELASETC